MYLIIYDITINSASLLDYTLATSTNGSQHTAEKEGDIEGGIYNRTTRGYCNVRLTNGQICLNMTLWFYNVYTRFNKNTYYFQQVGRD